MLQVVLFMTFKWAVKKHRVVKVLLALWETFLYENKCTFKSQFLEVGGLVTKNIYVFLFIASRALLKGKPNSIEFYKGIFFYIKNIEKF